MQQYVVSCLGRQSVSLSFFIGELSPLMLRDIKEKSLLLLLFLLLELGFCSCGYLFF